MKHPTSSFDQQVIKCSDTSGCTKFLPQTPNEETPVPWANLQLQTFIRKQKKTPENHFKKIPLGPPNPKKTINIAIHGFFTPMPPSPWALESPHAPPFLPPVAKVKVPQVPQVQQECLEASYQRLRHLEVPTSFQVTCRVKCQDLPKALASIDMHDYIYVCTVNHSNSLFKKNNEAQNSLCIRIVWGTVYQRLSGT